MDLKTEIPAFVGTIVKGRGELLRQKIGNVSDPINIKHESLKKAYDYAVSINTSEKGWVAFITKWEKIVREIMICNKAKKSTEDRLFKIVVEILKIK
jgi:hypothetical protein